MLWYGEFRIALFELKGCQQGCSFTKNVLVAQKMKSKLLQTNLLKNRISPGIWSISWSNFSMTNWLSYFTPGHQHHNFSFIDDTSQIPILFDCCRLLSFCFSVNFSSFCVRSPFRSPLWLLLPPPHEVFPSAAITFIKSASPPGVPSRDQLPPTALRVRLLPIHPPAATQREMTGHSEKNTARLFVCPYIPVRLPITS